MLYILDNYSRNNSKKQGFKIMCHSSCLTCLTQQFNSCLSCPNTLTLYNGYCICTAWQQQCTSQIALRQLFMFLDMFITIMLVGIMVLYALKVRLPISYRIWSALNGLSLLIYNQAFYIDYEDQFSLKTLTHTNGPYFMTSRIMPIGIYHIFPTMVVAIVTISLILLFFFPHETFNNKERSFCEYLKQTALFYFDCFYFFASKMMYFFIGKAINQLINSSMQIAYIIVMAVYLLICVLGIVRVMVQYHQGTILHQSYSDHIYLYTMLSPAAMIGLALISSQYLFTIIYCAPLVLLLLILILNRNMKISTRSHIQFFITEILLIGLTITYILVNGTIKSYIIIVIDFICILVVFFQVIKANYSGIDLSTVKVYPEDVRDYEIPKKKKIYGGEQQSEQQKEKGSYI